MTQTKGASKGRQLVFMTYKFMAYITYYKCVETVTIKGIKSSRLLDHQMMIFNM